MYGLCDCNNFFCSCERVFNPSLNGKPVVVLSNNDGCVIARSNEAKALGIKMGTPLYQVRELIEKNGVTVFSSNYKLYGDMSHRVMSILREHAPAIEVYSIDEAFIDFSGFPLDDLQQRGQQLAKRIQRGTGIPVSIGIAPTKTLAKVASKLCKKYPKLMGACLMYRAEDVEKVLKMTPIEDIWGIGRRYTKMLNENEIRTAYDFTQRTPEWVRAKMSVVGLRTWHELRGKPCIELEHNVQGKKQIAVTRSFPHEITVFEELHQNVAQYASACCEKLRAQNGVCSQVQVFIVTNRHRPDLPQSYENRLVKLSVATDSTLDITKVCASLLRNLYMEGYKYKRAGVILSDISSRSSVQQDLFNANDRLKHDRLMATVDTLNRTHGRHKVVTAAAGFNHFVMNRNHLSPQYTTDWSQIMEVKAE